MSAFMSDRTPEERRYFRLQMLVYDILRAEDDGRIVAPRMVDGFVDQILALDPKDGTQSLSVPQDELALIDRGEENSSAVSQSARALHGAPSGDEPPRYLPHFVWSDIEAGDMGYHLAVFALNTREQAEAFRTAVTKAAGQ